MECCHQSDESISKNSFSAAIGAELFILCRWCVGVRVVECLPRPGVAVARVHHSRERPTRFQARPNGCSPIQHRGHCDRNISNRSLQRNLRRNLQLVLSFWKSLHLRITTLRRMPGCLHTLPRCCPAYKTRGKLLRSS